MVCSGRRREKNSTNGIGGKARSVLVDIFCPAEDGIRDVSG